MEVRFPPTVFLIGLFDQFFLEHFDLIKLYAFFEASYVHLSCMPLRLRRPMHPFCEYTVIFLFPGPGFFGCKRQRPILGRFVGKCWRIQIGGYVQ